MKPLNPLKHLLSALTGVAATAPGALAASALAAPLLEPIGAAQPCGESLEYDTEFAVLQARLEPRAEVQYGSFSSKPDAPDWAEVERDARRLLGRTKDISILIWFTRARCRLGGAAGLLQGLATLQAVLQAYPAQVHPQPVLDGVPDLAVRANALAALCDPEGLLGDVRDVVVMGNTAQRLCVRDVERALAFPRPPYAADPDVVRRQLADLHSRGDANLAALLACGACLQAIEQWSQDCLHEAAPSLTPVLRLVGALASFADAPARSTKLRADAVEPASEPESQPAVRPHTAALRASEAQVAALPQHPRALEEREQVRALLRQARLWVEHHEPSSPVSVLLKQAERMWGKRFSEIATQIPPDLLQAWDRDD